MSEDQRHAARHWTLKGGRIVFNHGNSTIACTIRDLSEIGSRLKVASSVGIPDEFTLVFDDPKCLAGMCGAAPKTRYCWGRVLWFDVAGICCASPKKTAALLRPLRSDGPSASF
jgi:hypothetical protein